MAGWYHVVSPISSFSRRITSWLYSLARQVQKRSINILFLSLRMSPTTDSILTDLRNVIVLHSSHGFVPRNSKEGTGRTRPRSWSRSHSDIRGLWRFAIHTCNGERMPSLETRWPTRYDAFIFSPQPSQNLTNFFFTAVPRTIVEVSGHCLYLYQRSFMLNYITGWLVWRIPHPQRCVYETPFFSHLSRLRSISCQERRSFPTSGKSLKF